MPHHRRLYAWLLTLALGSVPATLEAQPSVERLEQAKSLFREGNALLSAGDPERALERFLASREALASGKNTANAAICLERLGRYDEALEMYEELLARFAADIDEQDRQKLAPIMTRLRDGLGKLDISANVEAQLTIDGKPRGKLPRVTALRALPGRRRVRVVKEGYRTFEVVVDVRAGQSVAVDAPLEPLSGLGALRVEPAGNAQAELLLDGQSVGQLPWEGTLRTGVHLLQALGQNIGSKPQTAHVIEGKTELIRVSLRALGAPVRIVVRPASAALLLNGVPLGHGKWAGRLPVGVYRLRAEESGYFSLEKPIAVAAANGPAGVRLDLEKDLKSPRWPKHTAFRYAAGVGSAFFYAPTLQGGQEALCPTLCQGNRAATGASFEGTLELLHELGVGAEVGVGYLFANQSFTRAAFENDAPARVSYTLQQQLVFGGAYGRAAAVAQLPLVRGFKLRTALGVALVAAAYEARASGTVSTSPTEVAPAEGSGYTRISELLPAVTTGIRIEHSLGPLHLSVGLDAWFAPRKGPRFPGVELQVDVSKSCPRETPQAVGCAPASGQLSREPVHGRFAALLPELAVRYRF